MTVIMTSSRQSISCWKGQQNSRCYFKTIFCLSPVLLTKLIICLKGEWQQAGKKPKRQQHNHQTAAENHHDDHNHHQTDEFYDESGEGHQDLSLTRNSRTRGGFNGNSDQPPRFRGRGGGGRGGFANGEYKGEQDKNIFPSCRLK